MASSDLHGSASHLTFLHGRRVTPVPYGGTMTFEQPLPGALSPSRLADFLSCPRKYQHASVERIPQPASYAAVKGTVVHYVLEHLLDLAPEERTIERARTFVPAALDQVLTEDVRRDLASESDLEGRLLGETEAILITYFAMEDPRAVHHEGVELRLSATVNGAPILGILDRLDRDADGQLTIVDYKTGGLPNRNFDSFTFANTELYAALCREGLGEQPRRIRLLYVAQGETVERPVSDVVVAARADAAARAWDRITRFYDAGDFPATPSTRACRFCAYQDLCRADGVAVPA